VKVWTSVLRRERDVSEEYTASVFTVEGRAKQEINKKQATSSACRRLGLRRQNLRYDASFRILADDFA
jgi:predicted membrane chloride channel (bestrophin family)